jgi:uroporphyrinogen decarboxylase
MTHRERVIAALDHRSTDRIPIALVCSGINAPAMRDLERYLGAHRGATVQQYLEPLIDIRHVGPDYTGPNPARGSDIWGVERSPVSYGNGAYEEIVCHPLADVRDPADLDRYPWPTTDWFDYGRFANDLRAAPDADYCLMISGGNPFETAWYMLGLERALEGLVSEPELVQAVLDRVTAFYVEHTVRQLEAADGLVDLVFTADDLGGQRGLLLSIKLWERHIRPCHEALNRTIHQFGARVIYHSDGAIGSIAERLADAGIDVLQALQFDAEGMDPADLKGRLGHRIGFEGGISVQSTLPFGTPDDVRREVRDRITVLGAGGGYILGPSHAIQAGTPPENVVAMFDEASRPITSA